MMRAAHLNDLYSKYLQDREDGLDPLMDGVRKFVLPLFQNDDDTQDFLQVVLNRLPSLVVTSSFSGCVRRLALWRRTNNNNRRGKIEMQPPVVIDSEGRRMTDEESLDLLAARERNDDPYLDSSTITDSVIRRAAELLSLGHTQAETAQLLGLRLDSLRRRVSRYREDKTLKKAA